MLLQQLDGIFPTVFSSLSDPVTLLRGVLDKRHGAEQLCSHHDAGRG